jgi:hypothetical protein
MAAVDTQSLASVEAVMGRMAEAWSEQNQQERQEQEFQQSILGALIAARTGKATDDDWHLIFWCCGFASEAEKLNQQITDCVF